MGIVNKFISVLKGINFKTIYFNFTYLPFKQAILLPIAVSRHVFLLKTKGKIIIEMPVRPGIIKIGYKGVGLFDHKRSRSIWEVSGTVIFKGKTFIGHGSKISVGDQGKLIIGQNFVVTAESTIAAIDKIIEFGDNCLLSWDSLIMSSDYHKIYDSTNEQINKAEDVFIGNHVWIGCRCLILKGTYIPDNSVIAANSLVNKKLDGECKLFGGQPAKELKANIKWSE